MHAAIDVGTNTVRLLIGETDNGRVLPAHYDRRITRLGGGFTSAGLASKSMERTLAALLEFAGTISDARADRVRGVGTEILRIAGNAGDFIQRVAVATGISLDVIDGEEEARLTAAGCLSGLDPRPGDCLIVDIGGGSTEFTLCHAGEALLHRSYPLGVVRLAENFADAESRLTFIEEVLARFRTELKKKNLLCHAKSSACRLIGTAGTITTLAALHLKMTRYDWRRVNNLTLHAGEIRGLHEFLLPLSIVEREELPGMEKGRGDLIVPGMEIVLALLEMFSREDLTVSDFGLLEGVLLETAGQR